MNTKNKLWAKHRRGAKRQPLHHKILKLLIGLTSGSAVLIAAIYMWFQVSPWPMAMLIRYEFEKGGQHTSQALQKHVPPGIAEVQNQQYRPNEKDAYMDVFYPERVKNTSATLPAVVWVHGGGWVSGDKDEVDNYLKILASYGFTTVGVNYSIAPEKTYPVPINQVNDALEYINRHARQLHIDAGKIALAGDSAGSQIAAQVANIINSPDYASQIGIGAAIQPHQLKAVVLNCGAYDLNLPNYSGPDGMFLRTVLWAYSGKKDFLDDPYLKTASVANYVTAKFPPTFLTAGNADPLEEHSTELAKKLQQLNVPTSTLFYADDHQPQLPHEYQFNLDNQDGQNALRQIIAFLRQYNP